MVTQGYPQYEIAGIGFDATCSTVAIDTDNNPLTVSTTGECAVFALSPDFRVIGIVQYVCILR